MSATPNTVEEFVDENHELLTRLLAHGNSEAQGYALAALVNGGTDDDIDHVIQILEDLKTDADDQ